MTTKANHDEQSPYALAVMDGEDMALPAPLALRMTGANSRAQHTMTAEIANRGYALDGHRLLGQQAHEGVGRAARVAGAQFHRSVVQHSQLVTAAKGLPFVQYEQEFYRLNLQQQMQNHFAVSDGMAQNCQKQVVTALYEPTQKPKKWWER